MRSVIIIVSWLAVAACSPSLGVLNDIAGGGLGGGGAGGSFGAIPGAAVGAAIGGGLVAAGTGAAIGAALGGGAAVGAAIGGGLVAGGTGAAIGAALGGDLLGDAPPAGGKDIFHALGIFTKGIPDAVGKDKLIFEDVVNLKLPGVLQDGFVSLIVVGRADGGIVNTIIPGFGTLLGNVVIAIGKIFDCVLAPQG
ncbi:uncharacterized protein isoform X5 [Choristoneura fumiferana]|uniref:uncharacterized protein isoform X5 n=1 Tax=Choristoneura fumiferana TaxID=7141 RepID=UPI003D15ED48